MKKHTVVNNSYEAFNIFSKQPTKPIIGGNIFTCKDHTYISVQNICDDKIDCAWRRTYRWNWDVSAAKKNQKLKCV